MDHWEDIQLKSPVLLGMVKLLTATMVLLNILGGIWYAQHCKF